MIEPLLTGDALLADVHGVPAGDGHFHLWWLGQSGFLVAYQGRHLLIDPYLSDSLTRKYAGTARPHVRMTRRPIDPRRLDFIDLVTSSHNHTDHLDAETLTKLLQANGPRLAAVVPEANRALAAERLAVSPERLLGIDQGETLCVAGFEIHAVPAAHETLEPDEQGRLKCLGYVFRFGRWSVYHSGDTILYDGMAERLKRWPIDAAILPINGRNPERGVPGNLTGREAARLGREIEARVVIPCHFDMFTFNTVAPDEFIGEANRVHQPYRVLQCGERWSSVQLGLSA